MGPNPKLRRHRVLARMRSRRGRGAAGAEETQTSDRRPQAAGRRPQAADRRPQTARPPRRPLRRRQPARRLLTKPTARALWDPATPRLRAPPEREEGTHVYPKTRTRGVTALPSATARTAPALDRSWRNGLRHVRATEARSALKRNSLSAIWGEQTQGKLTLGLPGRGPPPLPGQGPSHAVPAPWRSEKGRA